MIYPIFAYGQSVLKKKGSNVEEMNAEVETLISDMFETMDAANGVGLAAPQIGKSLRLFVIDSKPMYPEDENAKGIRSAFINPEIIEETGEEFAFEEGCLSIPEIRESVFRLPNLKIRYWDENFVEQNKVFDGMNARVIQHEYDHIEGILFIDHLSAFKKRLIKSKLTNVKKGKTRASYPMKFVK